MTIDYLGIAEKATQVLEKIMNEKTGEELQEIFSLGAEAFDKMKAAAMIAAGMVERIVVDLVEEHQGLPDDVVTRNVPTQFDDIVIEGVEMYRGN